MTYDARQADSKGQFRRDGMHPVEHVHLACLVLILQVAVIKVLLDVEDHLAIILVFHHEDAREDAIEGQRVLTLQLNASILAGVLITSQEGRPVLIRHLIRATAHHLHGRGELGGLGIAELPRKRGHEVLAKRQR